MTKFNVKSSERITIEFFVFILSNYVYYLNNVKSFFLCTLTCRFFRKTFVTVLLKFARRYLHIHIQERGAHTNTICMAEQAIKRRNMIPD
jgi:hypothetical protein